ncbi:unnamed protein product [Acanthosepion pharaonis]|uniref:Uncharacterized protein n=1 Tax=Acanthosepion pharaonis TaxID=158019 RepID=A0A812EA06_ACAPH|nr:unnamed protein product [Sepia pharaonis]
MFPRILHQRKICFRLSRSYFRLLYYLYFFHILKYNFCLTLSSIVYLVSRFSHSFFSFFISVENSYILTSSFFLSFFLFFFPSFFLSFLLSFFISFFRSFFLSFFLSFFSLYSFSCFSFSYFYRSLFLLKMHVFFISPFFVFISSSLPFFLPFFLSISNLYVFYFLSISHIKKKKKNISFSLLSFNFSLASIRFIFKNLSLCLWKILILSLFPFFLFFFLTIQDSHFLITQM